MCSLHLYRSPTVFKYTRQIRIERSIIMNIYDFEYILKLMMAGNFDTE